MSELTQQDGGGGEQLFFPLPLSVVKETSNKRVCVINNMKIILVVYGLRP